MYRPRPRVATAAAPRQYRHVGGGDVSRSSACPDLGHFLRWPTHMTSMTEQATESVANVPLLEMRSLRVQFRELVAVSDVNLALHGGSLLGLIGPNGAGKTTLLRAVSGLQVATRGLIRVLGERVGPTESCDVMRRIGFTPDTPPAYEDLTVRQFLKFIAKGYDLSG